LEQGELADIVGVSAQTIRNWEQGRHQPSTAYLPALALGLVVTEAEVLKAAVTNRAAADGQTSANRGTGSEAGYEPERLNVSGRVDDLRPLGVKPLPVYRWGSMGDPRDHDSGPDPDRLEYPPPGRETLIGPNGFGVVVRGDSMSGRNLCDGDVCWVNPERPYRLGSLVLALVTNVDGESGMVVKTYAHTEVGDCLMSEPVSGKSTVVCQAFTIIGPVVGAERWITSR
jgi:SOS-response transcriptional repressor LexA